MLQTCCLEKGGITLKPIQFISSHFLSSLAGYHLALLKLSIFSICFCTVHKPVCLKDFLYSRKKKGKNTWCTWKIHLCSFHHWPNTLVYLLSMAISQLPLNRCSFAALLLLSHQVLQLQNWRTDHNSLHSHFKKISKTQWKFARGTFWDESSKSPVYSKL